MHPTSARGPGLRAACTRRLASTLLAALLVALLAVSFTACGGGGDDGPTPPAAATVSTVTVGALSPILIGATAQASATARDASGTTITGRTVTWSAANNAIATVSATGLVTGVAAGSTDITATINGRAGSTAITVQAPAPVVSTVTVALLGPLVVGTTAQAAATVREANGTEITGRTVTWGSTNTAVATVSATGLVTAVAAGSTEITATVGSVTGRAALTVSPVPAASVTVGALSPALVGATRQATATVRDAAGNTLTGRTVSWSSSNSAIATVNASGLVSGVAPGTATITASVEGRSGSTTMEIVNPVNIPFFDSKPFAGEYATRNFLDHDIPKQFVDNNGRFTAFWGEVLANLGGMVDGHSGYDWPMPVGTPLLAVGNGRVVRVDESSQSFFCPPLNRSVNDQKSVFLEFDAPGGVKLWAWYVHNSQNLVSVGQTVTAGQTIALSGNTGCSSDPHLHFEIFRVLSTTPQVLRTIDPYGWSGGGTDPWAVHVDGSPSIQLWKPGRAPLLWRETVNDFTAGSAFGAAVIAKVVFQGVDDARNPNNEYVEIALDSRVAATASLDGHRLRGDRSGLNFAIPPGVTLSAARPSVRFYSGSGSSTATEIYMGQSAGVWSNTLNDDCVRLVNPGGAQYRWNLGNGCPLPGPSLNGPMASLQRVTPLGVELNPFWRP